jgi:hypothetical protein
MGSDLALLTIGDDDVLYRRILRWHIKDHGTVSSAAFKDRKGRPDGIELARLTTAEECAARPGKPGFGVIALAARVPRRLDLAVRHDPLPDNYAHALIEGENTQRKCEMLARAAAILLSIR